MKGAMCVVLNKMVISSEIELARCICVHMIMDRIGQVYVCTYDH